jgi:hypothetical protein
MRVACRRPEKDKGHLLRASVRKSVRRHLAGADSYVLFPLEDTLKAVFDLVEAKGPTGVADLMHAVAAASVPDPRVGLAVLDALERYGAIDTSSAGEARKALSHLVDIDLKGRLFAIWCRSRKGDDPDADFARFFSEQARQVAGLLGPGADDKALSYIMDVGPMTVPLLDWRLILMEARKTFFIGVKRFSSGSLDDAEAEFKLAWAMNPWNPFTLWNLARVSALKGGPADVVTGFYEDAVRRAPKGSLSTQIVSELADFRRDERKLGTANPIPSYDQ